MTYRYTVSPVQVPGGGEGRRYYIGTRYLGGGEGRPLDRGGEVK